MTVLAQTKPIVSVNGIAATGRQQFVRDYAVPISVTFYDDAGNVVTPSTATLTLSFLQNNVRTFLDYSLTQSGNNWTYTWDSSIANPCEVYGHVTTSAPIYAVDFQFRLTANKASREKSGDDDECPGYSI